MEKTPTLRYILANRWGDDKIKRLIQSRLRDRMRLVGEFVEGSAKLRAPVDTGRLRASIRYRVISFDRVRIGTTAIYAAIHEFGGVIKPVTPGIKFLTIPLTKEARRNRARDFDDLFFLESKDGEFFLAREKGSDLEFMYRLVKKVRMPARPYLRPAIYENKAAIKRILAR